MLCLRLWVWTEVYTQEQIEKWSLADWVVNRIINMPKRLFKYYRNVIDEENGRNYSFTKSISWE